MPTTVSARVPLPHCVTAVLIVAVATLIRIEFLPELGMRAPFLTLYPAVFLAALFCELAGGILATVVSYAAAVYLWMDPAKQLLFRTDADQLTAAVFLVSGLIVSYAADKLRRLKAASAQALIVEERSQAEKQLRESELRLTYALEGGGMATWEWEIGSNRVFWSDDMFSLLGVSPKEKASVDRLLACLHNDDAPAYKLAVADVLEHGSDLCLEFRVVLGDGDIRWLRQKGHLFHPTGQPSRMAGVTYDITLQKRCEEDLRTTQMALETRVEERTSELLRTSEALQRETDECKRAMEANRHKDQLLIQQSRLAAMGELVGNIAHQWRQPLNTLGLIVQELPVMFKGGELTEPYINEQVAKSTEIIGQMSKTLNGFSNFFTPSNEKESFRVIDMINKSLGLVEENFNEVGIKVEIAQVGDPLAYGYPAECSQVLLNLLLNARDAFLQRTDTGPRNIVIKVFSEGRKSVVVVADNAGGIPEDIIGKIFEPYFTTKGPGQGTGIGLFMAKNIIEGHMNGKLTAGNSESGAEFRLELESTPAS